MSPVAQDLSDPPPVKIFQDPWTKAFKNLSVEEQKQFGSPDTNLLGILDLVQKDAKINEKRCRENGWTVYKNKDGQEVKLRHVLEKISRWITATISVIDTAVSFDQSGYAALPWGVVKFLITVGTNDVAIFSQVSEAVETISGLIARYTVFEKLYLHEDCESTPKLHEAICVLYTAVLGYLSKARSHFSGGSLRRLGRTLLDPLGKAYEELWSKITEVDVEKWARLVDAELQRKQIKDESEHYTTLKSLLDDLNQPIMQISDQISQIQDKFSQDERRALFQWISKIEYAKHHEELSKDLLVNSGQWLLNSLEYIEWGHSSLSSILWIHGIPGSGKTKLVSTVVNQIFKAYSNLSAPPIAYFYCLRSEAERERAMPLEIMRTILRQLARTDPQHPVKRPIADEYEIRKKKADQDGSSPRALSMEDCIRLILELTDENPATIVIDALDECNDNYELLKALNEIVDRSSEIVKVFISSRDDVDIKLHLARCSNISIDASQNKLDIDRFIESELDRLITGRALLRGEVSEKLRAETAKALSKGAQGMFRWVVMSLEYLRTIRNKKTFSEALGELPPKLSSLYDIVYSQIDEAEPNERHIAMTTLKWLLCAERLLSEKELIEAVSADFETVSTSRSASSVNRNDAGDDNDNEEDEEEDDDEEDQNPSAESSSSSGSEMNSTSSSEILQVCRNLVVMDLEGNFRFAHQSVREYLQTRQEFFAEELQAFALDKCLDYCTAKISQDAEKGADLGEKDLDQQRSRREFHFMSYAHVYWPVHYQKVEAHIPTKLRKKILPFFLQDSEVSTIFAAWTKYFSEYNFGWQINREILNLDIENQLGYRLIFATRLPPSPLKAACAFGLLSLMDEFRNLPTDMWTQRSSATDSTLLHIAAAEDQVLVLQKLLDTAIEPNSKDVEGFTPLHRAASRGSAAAVKFLLKTAKVDSEARDTDQSTPLHAAAAHGSKMVVKLLLDTAKVDPCVEDIDGVTPLHAAAAQGSKAVAKLLLDTGKVNPDCKDADGRTPLFFAVSHGSEAVTKLLLETGKVNANLVDLIEETPLHVAAYQGSESVVRLLLEIGKADPNSRNREKRTPLHIAAAGGYESVVRLLLETGLVDPDAKDEDDQTPLSLAAYRGQEIVVRLLLQTEKADPNSKDKNGDTPLHNAAIKQDKLDHGSPMIKLLLETNTIEVCSRNSKGQTPLHIAAISGSESAVQLLLEHDMADPTSKDGDGQTPLHLAAETGSESLVKLFLDTGKIDLDSKNNAGETVSEIADDWGNNSLVRFLERYRDAIPVRTGGRVEGES